MQAIYKRRGLQEKSGLAARERKEAHPELVSLTSTTQQGAGQMSGGHSASAGDFLEKELHRRYSKRELHNNKSVPYQKSQGCHVLFKKEKRQSTKPQSDLSAVELFQRQQVDDTASSTWLLGTFLWRTLVSSLQSAKRKVTNLLQLNIKLNTYNTVTSHTHSDVPWNWAQCIMSGGRGLHYQ